MPSLAPTSSPKPKVPVTLAPNSSPTEGDDKSRIIPLKCPNNKNIFKIVMSPGTDYKSNDLSVKVYRLGKDGKFTNHAFRRVYNQITPKQENKECLWKKLCMKAVVVSKSGAAGLSKASFNAYWDSKLLQSRYNTTLV